MGQRFRIPKRTQYDKRFSKEVKLTIVVDKWLHSLILPEIRKKSDIGANHWIS